MFPVYPIVGVLFPIDFALSGQDGATEDGAGACKSCKNRFL